MARAPEQGVGLGVVDDLLLHGIPPDARLHVAADAHDVVVGGGGMLRGLDERLAVETEIPVHLVDAPLECVVLGAGRCIEAYEDLKVMFMDART